MAASMLWDLPEDRHGTVVEMKAPTIFFNNVVNTYSLHSDLFVPANNITSNSLGAIVSRVDFWKVIQERISRS